MRSNEESAPTKTGAKAGEMNSPRSSTVTNLSLRGVGPLVDPGGLVGTKLMARAMESAHRNPYVEATIYCP